MNDLDRLLELERKGLTIPELKQKIESAIKLQELLKGDKIINLKSLIRGITNCTSAHEEIHARRYEEEIFAFLDELQKTVKELGSEGTK